MGIIITGYPIIKLTFLSPIFTFESYHQYEYISDIWSDIFLHRRNQRIRFSLLAGFYCVSTWFNAKNREISVFRFLSDFILTPLDSAYSIYLICRFWLHFDLKRYEKPIFLGLPVFCRSWFYFHRNQRTQFAIHADFGRVLIWQSMKNRVFSDFRFFVGLDFIII